MSIEKTQINVNHPDKWFYIGCVALIILFAGEPDIADALRDLIFNYANSICN